MKKLILILVVAVFTLPIQAQDSAKAEKLLNEVSQKVKAYDNMVIDFKYALDNTAENMSQETKGDLSLSGEKYVLNLFGVTQMFDGKKTYIIKPEDEEIDITSYREEDSNSISPSKIFSFYEEGYNYEMDITQNVGGREIQYVKLTPKDSNAEIRNILLGIDKQTKHIYNLIQTQDNGTKITITVKSFKTNQPLAKNLFTFNESRYSNYYINRLD